MAVVAGALSLTTARTIVLSQPSGHKVLHVIASLASCITTHVHYLFPKNSSHAFMTKNNNRFSCLYPINQLSALCNYDVSVLGRQTSSAFLNLFGARTL